MKDYQALFDKGYKYSQLAADNWDNRRSKLQAMYITPRHGLSIQRRHRIMVLIGVIDERMNRVMRFLRWAGMQRLREYTVTSAMVIELRRPSVSCNRHNGSFSLYLPLKQYVPDKEKCKSCGTPLLTKEDLAVQKMLFDMGITSQNE
ncbi:MAG: hypothetical protein INR73_28175 [Williamsia sp.]|nr:hypothetical protein [Williamsia sp.]